MAFLLSAGDVEVLLCP